MDVPYAIALTNVLRRGTRRTSAFLAVQLQQPLPADLGVLFATWCEYAASGPVRIGAFELSARQPERMDRIAYSWKHADYGCDDLEVNGTLPGIGLGVLHRWEHPLLVYVQPTRRYEGLHLATTPWQEGSLEAGSLEELLRLEHARVGGESPLTPFLKA